MPAPETDWYAQGCPRCRLAALRVMSELIEVGVVRAQHVTVYRCPTCSSLWEETDREAHVIPREVAIEYGLRV